MTQFHIFFAFFYFEKKRKRKKKEKRKEKKRKMKKKKKKKKKKINKICSSSKNHHIKGVSKCSSKFVNSITQVTQNNIMSCIITDKLLKFIHFFCIFLFRKKKKKKKKRKKNEFFFLLIILSKNHHIINRLPNVYVFYTSFIYIIK